MKKHRWLYLFLAIVAFWVTFQEYTNGFVCSSDENHHYRVELLNDTDGISCFGKDESNFIATGDSFNMSIIPLDTNVDGQYTLSFHSVSQGESSCVWQAQAIEVSSSGTANKYVMTFNGIELSDCYAPLSGSINVKDDVIEVMYNDLLIRIHLDE